MKLQKYNYSAFISYKHLDKEHAVWVQKKIESYRLPTKICKEYGLHKKLKKCFRDEGDLSSGVLKDGQYIDYEIETFRKIRGDEYIIPLIFDGRPVGLGELTSSQVKNKSNHYTIIERNTFEGWNFLPTYTQYEVRFENNKNTLIEPMGT